MFPYAQSPWPLSHSHKASKVQALWLTRALASATRGGESPLFVPLAPGHYPRPLYLGHCPLPTVHWPMDHNDIPWLLQVRRMFLHAYHGYAKYAFPLDELKPKSCRGEDTLGGYALTLVSLLQPPCTEHCHHCNILPATPCSWQNLTQDRNQDWSQEWSVPCGPSCN